MAANSNRFTPEQIAILSRNPYVKNVDRYQISFTAEFKARYWHMHNDLEIRARDIFREHGIDPSMFGASRIRGITQNIKKQYERYGAFFDGSNRERKALKDMPVSEAEANRLRAEVEYLKQERDFLKKILSAATNGESK